MRPGSPPPPTARVAGAVPSASGSISARTLARAEYPEGPFWRGPTLYFVEYGRNALNALEDGRPRQVYAAPGLGPAAAILGHRGDDVWITAYDQNALHHVDLAGRLLEPPITATRDGRAIKGPNDMVLDAHGGLYFTGSGVFDRAAPVEGKVFYRAQDGAVRQVAADIHYANGLALSPDGQTLYVSEHLANRVLSFPVGAGGALGQAEIFRDLASLPAPATADPKLGPDGMKMGPDGHLYVAQYGGGRIIEIDPGSRRSWLHRAPLPYTTNLSFRPGSRMLTVTAFARDEAPYAGSVLEIGPGSRIEVAGGRDSVC